MQKKTQFYSWALSGLFIIFLISSCSSDKDNKLWDETILVNNLYAYENYLDNFPEGKYNVAAGDSLQKILFTQAENSNSVLQMIDKKVSIPRYGKLQQTDSLNVATATAILLSEFKRLT